MAYGSGAKFDGVYSIFVIARWKKKETVSDSKEEDEEEGDSEDEDYADDELTSVVESSIAEPIVDEPKSEISDISKSEYTSLLEVHENTKNNINTITRLIFRT